MSPQPAGSRTGRGEGRVQDGNLQCALGVGPGDNPPAAGRDNDHGFFSQGLEGKLHGNGGAATGTPQMPGIHQIIVLQDTGISIKHLSLIPLSRLKI
jgi:hypothetical protein